MWGSLTHHLDALRARLALVLGALLALALVGWMVHPQLMDWLVGPWCGDANSLSQHAQCEGGGVPPTDRAPHCALTTLTLTGGIWARVWVASLPVVLVGTPIALWQGWWFCIGDSQVTKPRQTPWVGWQGLGLGALGLWVATIGFTAVGTHPLLGLMVRFGEPWVHPLVTIDGVLSAMVGLFLAILSLLLIPVAVGMALHMRLISPADLSRGRRGLVMVALIVAAILTPTTDPLTMLVVALGPILSVECVRLGAIVIMKVRAAGLPRAPSRPVPKALS